MFSLGAGPVPSLLLSEILPSRVRAKAMAVCMAVHWVIVSLLFFHFLSNLVGKSCYFSGLCIYAVETVCKLSYFSLLDYC